MFEISIIISSIIMADKQIHLADFLLSFSDAQISPRKISLIVWTDTPINASQ